MKEAGLAYLMLHQQFLLLLAASWVHLGRPGTTGETLWEWGPGASWLIEFFNFVLWQISNVKADKQQG